MAYALIYNNTGYVTIPTKTSPVTGIIYDAYWKFSTYAQVQSLTGNSLSTTNDSMFINNASQIRVRLAGETTRTITLTTPLPVDTIFRIQIEKQSGVLTAILDGNPNGTAAIGSTENSIGLTATYLGAHTTTGRNSGTCYECNFAGQQYLNTTSADETTWGDGTLTGIPSTNWVEYGGGPATITSTIAAGLPIPSAASTVNVQSTTISFTVAAGLPVPSASSAVTIVPAAGDPIFTSEPLYNNTNGATGLLANTLLDYVAIYSNTSPRNLILESANVTTDANGRFSVQSALLSSGVSYKVDWQVNSTGVSRMPVKAAV